MKLIVSDMDQTILGKDSLFSDYTKQVLLKAQEDGYTFMIASGRDVRNIVDTYVKDIDLEKYQGAIIGTNGLELYDYKDHQYRKGDTISYKQVRWIVNIASFLGCRVHLQSNKTSYDKDPLIEKIIDLLVYIKNHHHLQLPDYSWDNLDHVFLSNIKEKDFEIDKVILTPYYGFITPILLSFLHLFYERKHEIYQVSTYWIEIMPKGINKLNRILEYIDKYHIAKEDVYVFGDGDNDCAMLAYFEHSYAMSNANNNAKASAKHICLSHEEDGVARIIEEML